MRAETVDGATVSRSVGITEVSKILGVPMPTLRSWELRYGLPTMARSNGRHRRYEPADLHAIRMMRDEVARGRQAGAAAAEIRAVLGIDGPAGAAIHRLLDAAERLDGIGIRRGLDETAAALGLSGCIDDVLLPAMRQIGIWWEIGHCDLPQERTATEAVRAWLDKQSAFAPTATLVRPVLLVCGPSDQHTIGLEALALLLRHQGRLCRVLGARTPTDIAVAAARSTGAAAVVVVSQLVTARRRAVETIEAIDRLGVSVFYAGNAFAAPGRRTHVPGAHLGGRIGEACATITAALSTVG